MHLLAFLFLFASDTEGLEKHIKSFIDVFSTVQREAADPVQADRAFYEGAIPGMLRRLDPHSVFFDPGQYEQLKQMENSERKGFGSVVSVVPGRVTVLQTLPGTPSGKSGLAPGDEILAINGIPLGRLEFEQLLQLLSEARQIKVVLDVRRPGNVRGLQFSLTPELVDAPSVDRAFLAAPGIGYIRVTSFDAPTGKLIKNSIEKLGGSKLKGFILDLRGNPGGVAQAAVETAALFLKPGQRILTIKGRTAKGEELDVPKTAIPYEFPVAVLINAKSASSSEIVAGALQDHDRAVILGESSFGKGLVQGVFPLSSSTGMALTTAYYYTPSGRSIQHPLVGSMLETTTSKPSAEFHSDAGRPMLGGGGIHPDQTVLPAGVTPLQGALESSGMLVAFGAVYLRDHTVDEKFEVTPAMLDDLKVYLSERSIQPNVSEWLRERDWIQNRLHQEIANMALGIAKGDEVEARRDAVIQAAIGKLNVSGN